MKSRVRSLANHTLQLVHHLGGLGDILTLQFEETLSVFRPLARQSL